MGPQGTCRTLVDLVEDNVRCAVFVNSSDAEGVPGDAVLLAVSVNPIVSVSDDTPVPLGVLGVDMVGDTESVTVWVFVPAMEGDTEGVSRRVFVFSGGRLLDIVEVFPGNSWQAKRKNLGLFAVLTGTHDPLLCSITIISEEFVATGGFAQFVNNTWRLVAHHVHVIFTWEKRAAPNTVFPIVLTSPDS
jgi:hypothetical protein